MDQADALRALVSSSIKKYGNSTKLPPIKLEKLVVLAIIQLGKPSRTFEKPPVKQEHTHEWILDNFRHYRKIAYNSLWLRSRAFIEDGEVPDERVQKECEDFHARFRDAFKRFESPVEEAKKGWWTVSIPEAATYLSSLLPSTQTDNDRPFAFVRLPPEIRVRIYEIVLALPRSGILITPEKMNYVRWFMMTTISRDVLHADHEEWVRLLSDGNSEVAKRSTSRYICSPSETLLPLLLTNKSVSREAGPVFFDINLFVFYDVVTLSKFLECSSTSQVKHIRHILLILGWAKRNTQLFKNWRKEPLIRALEKCSSLMQVDVYASQRQMVGLAREAVPVAANALITLFGAERVRLFGNFHLLSAAFERAKKNAIRKRVEVESSKC